MNILIRFKNLVIETLKDNKKLIIGLYLLYIIFFIGAWIFSASIVPADLTNGSVNSTSVDSQDVGALELFINNEFGGIMTYFGSILFGIFAIVILIYNAVNLGLLGHLFESVIPNGGIKFLCYLIPHGIFEITATVLESVAGILLFLFIIRFIKAIVSSETHGISEAFDKTKKALIQSVVLMIFTTILLLIAAPIEAYVSVPFSQWVLGF